MGQILDILRGRTRYTPDEEARIRAAQSSAAEDSVQANVDKLNAMGATLRDKQRFNTGDFVDPRLNQDGGRVNPYHVGQEVGVGSPDKILRFDNGGVGRLPATATTGGSAPTSFDRAMAASGAGNAELRAAMNPVGPRQADGSFNAMLRTAPRMSAREQLSQGPDMQILRMQAGMGDGSVTQKAASRKLADMQMAYDAQQRQQAEAAKLAGDRKFAMDMKTAPVALAQQGAAERQTAQIQADKARYEAAAKAAMDKVTATGAVPLLPDGTRNPAFAEKLKAEAEKAEREYDYGTANEINKTLLASVFGTTEVTREQLEAKIGGQQFPPQSTASIMGEFDAAKAQANVPALPGTVSLDDLAKGQTGEQAASADIDGDGKVSDEEAEFNSASTMIERDDARIKAGQPAKMSAMDRARAEELIKKVRTDIRNKLTGKPQGA